MSDYNYKGKIPVYNFDPEGDDDGEWKEYHSNDIAEMKFWNMSKGFIIGVILSGIAFAYYFMK